MTKYGSVLFCLVQQVEIPTRITKSINDHIYYHGNILSNDTVVHVSIFSVSDHFHVHLTLQRYYNIQKDSNSAHKTIEYRCFKRFNKSSFQSDLLRSDLNLAETFVDTNESLSYLYNVLNNTLSIHAPVKKKRTKFTHESQWFTSEIQTSIFERKWCKKKREFDNYKLLRNKIRSLIKKSKKLFFDKAIKENKTSKFLRKTVKILYIKIK